MDFKTITFVRVVLASILALRVKDVMSIGTFQPCALFGAMVVTNSMCPCSTPKNVSMFSCDRGSHGGFARRVLQVKPKNLL